MVDENDKNKFIDYLAIASGTDYKILACDKSQMAKIEMLFSLAIEEDMSKTEFSQRMYKFFKKFKYQNWRISEFFDDEVEKGNEYKLFTGQWLEKMKLADPNIMAKIEGFATYVGGKRKILWRYTSDVVLPLEKVYPPKTMVVQKVIPMEEVIAKQNFKVDLLDPEPKKRIKTNISYQEAVENIKSSFKNKGKDVSEIEKSNIPEIATKSLDEKRQILDNLYKNYKNQGVTA